MIGREYLTLSQLYDLLSSERIGYGVLIFSIVFFFYMNLVWLMSILLIMIAIPFSLYMMIVLYKYDKKGWIYGFLILMGFSSVPLLFFPNDNLLLIAFKFAPLLAFVLYNMTLKMKVGEWLMEMDFESNMTDPLNHKTKL
ncbi:MAG: hypothetical protein U5K72_11400 [Balneolaceae bacterium]|nr:hypothetical protein [Balneolaceae bacterium]